MEQFQALSRKIWGGVGGQNHAMCPQNAPGQVITDQRFFRDQVLVVWALALDTFRFLSRTYYCLIRLKFSTSKMFQIAPKVRLIGP